MASEIDSFLTKQFFCKYNLPFFLWWFTWETHYFAWETIIQMCCGGGGVSVLDLWCIMMDLLDLLESSSTTPWHWSHNFLLNTFIHNAVKYLLYWAQNSVW